MKSALLANSETEASIARINEAKLVQLKKDLEVLEKIIDAKIADGLFSFTIDELTGEVIDTFRSLGYEVKSITSGWNETFYEVSWKKV